MITMEISEEKREELNRIKIKIDIANKCRLAFLGIAALVLAVVYFANKAYEGVAWYEDLTTHVYQFLTVDIACMLICTFVKFRLIVKHNNVVKAL